MTLLHVDGLRKAYRRKRLVGETHATVACADVSFSIERGETLALVGESGAGKSTVGRLVLRLIEPDDGSINFEGTDLRALSRRELRRTRQRMQMVFQDPYSCFDPRVSVGTSVAEPLKIHLGMNRVDREAAASALLDRVGLDSDYLRRFPYELSGGQLQRVAIARALSLSPALIVCDEPVAALDVSVRAQVLNLMLDLQEELGVAYLFISHDLSIVECLADTVAVMRAGTIVEIGETTQVFSSPRDAYTKNLLDAIPIADPTQRTFLPTAPSSAPTTSSSRRVLTGPREEMRI